MVSKNENKTKILGVMTQLQPWLNNKNLNLEVLTKKSINHIIGVLKSLTIKRLEDINSSLDDSFAYLSKFEQRKYIENHFIFKRKILVKHTHKKKVYVNFIQDYVSKFYRKSIPENIEQLRDVLLNDLNDLNDLSDLSRMNKPSLVLFVDFLVNADQKFFYDFHTSYEEKNEDTFDYATVPLDKSCTFRTSRYTRKNKAINRKSCHISKDGEENNFLDGKCVLNRNSRCAVNERNLSLYS
jgi:hypothetical protein